MTRDPRLQPLSRDHHHALVWARRLARVTTWTRAEGEALHLRFEAELEPHFRVEEAILLPALRAADRAPLADQVAAEHATLRALALRARVGDAAATCALGEHLSAHVRFEERVVFPACEDLEAALDALPR